ncbi:MAG: hypothetical protein QGG40_19810 [Myxococcota bacterium]|nr:hypothetical protein [Myxococcota bacterium]
MRLVIDRTWDGLPLPPEAHASVTLAFSLEGLEVFVDAPFHGDPVPPGAEGPTWGLWEYEVVELFLSGPGDRYLEVELGPWGHHLVLQLEGCRNIVARELPLVLRTRRAGERWTARAHVDVGVLPPAPHRVNATRIHGVGTARRYLSAVDLPGPKPDFHRIECFVPVTLSPSREAEQTGDPGY